MHWNIEIHSRVFINLQGNFMELFERMRSEFIILRIPMTENLQFQTEKWRFWFWTATGENFFFSVENHFFLFHNFNTATHDAH
jgi:hypothetical protein